MNTVPIAPDIVERVCRSATSASGPHTVTDLAHDPLDGSVWIRLTSWPRADEAHRALTDFGLAVTDADDSRLHVTGWDPRLLRRRLGGLLAAIDDLKIEWDATAELAAYFYDRRTTTGEDPDLADVLADLEATMRRAVPIPHRAPRVDDVATLLELITAAENAYEQLICQHIEHAERILTTRTTPGAA